MSQTPITVQVVTPVHNRRELTLQFLRSLAACDQKGLDVDIIVVDDGSTDGTADAIRIEFPKVEIVQGDGNLWYTGGLNLGIAAAMHHSPKYILCVNNDSEFDPQCLQSMVAVAERVPRSVVGAILVNWDDRKCIFQVAPKWSIWWGGMRHWVKQTVDTIPKHAWRVEAIVGNCFLLPAEAVREVGLMDAKRLPHYGDAEYTPRLRKAGWNLLIDPNARIYCKPNDVPPRLSEMSKVEVLRTALTQPHSPHSFKRRINSTLGSAPNKLSGVLALGVFFVRLVLRRNLEGNWAHEQEEKPLAELYRDQVVGPDTANAISQQPAEARPT